MRIRRSYIGVMLVYAAFQYIEASVGTEVGADGDEVYALRKLGGQIAETIEATPILHR